jgi:hypothetical protein
VLFAGTVRLLSPEEGGRHRPVFSDYRCQFRFLAEHGQQGDWDAMVLFRAVELSPGGHEPAVLFPPRSHGPWRDLAVPAQLGMYEGSRLIGTFDVAVRYAEGTG